VATFCVPLLVGPCKLSSFLVAPALYPLKKY
jgi:hypothetical protein